MLYWLLVPAAEVLLLLQRLPVHHRPDRPGRAHGPPPQPHPRALADPPPQETPDRPGDPDRRAPVPLRQERDAVDGRPPHHRRHDHPDPPLGELFEHLHLARLRGDGPLRRHRLRRRRPEGRRKRSLGLSSRQKLLLQFVLAAALGLDPRLARIRQEVQPRPVPAVRQELDCPTWAGSTCPGSSSSSSAPPTPSTWPTGWTAWPSA